MAKMMSDRNEVRRLHMQGSGSVGLGSVHHPFFGKV